MEETPNANAPEGRPASEVASMIAAELERQGVHEHELAEPIQAFGEAFIVLIGPHSEVDTGLCWCQPTMEWCPSGGSHKHPVHRNPVN